MDRKYCGTRPWHFLDGLRKTSKNIKSGYPVFGQKFEPRTFRTRNKSATLSIVTYCLEKVDLYYIPGMSDIESKEF
jgi:hypothetical protein